MTLFAHMVVRNEADRYLDACLAHLESFVDVIHVHDDTSDDETITVAQKHTPFVTNRLSTTPTFLEHEGQFREKAWQAFEFVFQPRETDWVLAIDADEFLVGLADRIGVVLAEAIERCNDDGDSAIDLPIPEVWGFTDEDVRPVVRVDKYWATIHEPRLFRFRPGGTFRNRSMACGAVPTYVLDGPLMDPAQLALLHCGYADPDDRRAKYVRYSNAAGGHATSHIESILHPPELEEWTGPVPAIYRGSMKVQPEEVR